MKRQAARRMRRCGEQYEQPGELVMLPSGIQFREILEASGRAAELGAKCSIRCAFCAPPPPPNFPLTNCVNAA